MGLGWDLGIRRFTMLGERLSGLDTLITTRKLRIRELSPEQDTEAESREEMTQPGMITPQNEPFHIPRILVHRNQPRPH